MIELPWPIAAYVEAANAQAPARVAACFEADGTVRDEGSLRRGHEQIEQWAAETGARYRSTITPATIEGANGRYRLRAGVQGDFPGSPVTLDFSFVLGSERILALEIQ